MRSPPGSKGWRRDGSLDDDQGMTRPLPGRSTSVILVVGGWLASVVVCGPVSLIAGSALADLLAPKTGRASGDLTWFLLALLIFAVLVVLVTVGWSWVWRRGRYVPLH